MLTKTNRLSRTRDFDRVYRKGRRLKIDSLLVSYLATKNEASRLGFVVSKKVAGKASRRNYLKRVLRAALRELPKSLKISYDVIVSLTFDPANNLPKPLKLFKYFQATALKLGGRLNA